MRLSAWHVPIEHLSASSVAQFMQCPEQFRLRRIKKIPESTGLEKFIGIVDHSTHQENFTRKIRTGTDLSKDEIGTAYNNAWMETNETEQMVWDSETSEQELTFHLGSQMVNTYHETVSPTVYPIKVEERFEQRLPNVPVPVVGYTDIETKEKLIERKTTKTKLSKPKPQWVLQGRLYGLTHGKSVDWHLVTRQKTPQVLTPTEEPGLRIEPFDPDGTVRLFSQMAELLNDMYLRFGPDNPWPTIGVMHPFLCGYCGFGPKYGRQCIAWKEPNR